MKYGITTHALLRYAERVKPCHSFDQARHELEILVEQAGEPHGKPEWYFLPEERDRASEFYLTLSDGIIAALRGDVVATVITRGGGSPKFKQLKAEHRKQKRQRRRGPRISLRGRVEEPKQIWR